MNMATGDLTLSATKPDAHAGPDAHARVDDRRRVDVRAFARRAGEILDAGLAEEGREGSLGGRVHPRGEPAHAVGQLGPHEERAPGRHGARGLADERGSQERREGEGRRPRDRRLR